MTAADIVEELRPLGQESYRKVLRNHGIPDPMLGVKIDELKKIQKRVKKDHGLALDLFDTGIYDVMYLACLVADDARMTREDLRGWLRKSNCATHCEITIPWVAAGSPHGLELAREWIGSEDADTATAGWSTLSSLVSVLPDSALDLDELTRLLERVTESIQQQPNLVRYHMNGFVIAVGRYVAPLSDQAFAAAQKIGVVTVDMGNTACKVPYAPDYIEKARSRGTIGKKRKSAKC